MATDFDDIENMPFATVVTAPSPATTGTESVLDDASVLPAPPFNAVLVPANTLPTLDVAEIVRVTDITDDTVTHTRAQEGTTGKSVEAGWVLYAPVTKKGFQDMQTAINAAENSIADGWLPAGDTFTFGAADDPTYTMTTPGDKTSKYYPGQRIRVTQTTGGTKYFIVTKVAYSDPNTTVTLYGGSDYDLANEAISNPYYSMAKAPSGFPLDPDKWTEILIDTTQRSQGSITGGVWYNLGSLSLTIPIGAWRVSYQVHIVETRPSGSECSIYSTLSTANNSESDSHFTAFERNSGSPTYAGSTVYREKYLNLASKTPYYLNAKSDVSASATLYFNNDDSACIIRAVCAYL